MSSQFLPPNFDRRQTVAVIAGKDIYPKLTVDSMKKAGVGVRMIAFEGETRRDLVDSLPADAVSVIKVGQLGHLLAAIGNFEADYAIMVGQITPRRLFRGLHPDLKAIQILSSLKVKNAATIFGAVSREIEKLGVGMLDARAFLDHDLAEPGLMSGGTLEMEEAWLEHGIRIAQESARLDIGQSVVVRKGTVIAVEAFEGTDEMLRRAGHFQTDNLIFVKTAKPEQDFRFDVPVFGMKTLAVMREAGIRLASLEAGRILVLDKKSVLEEARNWKIQIFGHENI